MESPTIAVNVVKSAKHRQIGACVLRRTNRTGPEDNTIYSIELFDFFEENESFANLDSFLIQIGGGTFYFPDELENSLKGDGKKLANLLHGKEMDVVFTKKSNFSKKADVEARVLKLTGRSTHATNTAETERPLAYTCLECLMHTMRLMDDESSFGQYDLRIGSLNTVMRLDSAAAEAVNLLPRPDHPSQYGSIFGVLNRCKTKMGSRLLERWLRQPLLDISEIETRLNCVTVFKDSTLHRNQLLDGALKGIPDVDVILTKMQKKKSSLEEIFRIYVFSLALPAMCTVLADMVDSYQGSGLFSLSPEENDDASANSSNVAAPSLADAIRTRFLDPLKLLADKFTLYQQLIRHVIDMDELPTLQVSASHSEELQELKEERDQLENQAQKLLNRARNDWASFADVKLETSSQHGFYFRSTKCDDERQLRAQNKQVRILSMQKNGVHFTIPELEQIADRMQAIDAEYSTVQEGIVEKAVETALTYVPIAESAVNLVAEIDVLVSFATCAALAPGSYVRPKILPKGSGVLHLQEARHPCVELMDNVQFIPNDYDLERGKSTFQIVTGPNMGGKSTYIRAIGCIVVMAQVGSFVPCSHATISVVDAVLARVGAGDAVQKGVSTFMAEMLEASVILQTATPDSLIIIDELGRGTSTFDGFGLAWAISEYICTKLRSFCLFATHFHELTALATTRQMEGVVNKHVTAHAENGQLVMLYSVQPGPCEESFGVHIASLAGFPGTVISEAKRKAVELEELETATEEENAKFARIEEALAGFVAMPVDQMCADELKPHLSTLFPPFEVI